MGSETDQMKADIEAKREDISRTVFEIGDRLAVPKTTFIAGIATGIALLALLNRLQFRRGGKK